MNKILIDTNILIYGIDEDSQYFDQSHRILNSSHYELVTTSKNLVEFITVATRSSGYNLETEKVLNILDEIIQNMEIIYPTQSSLAILLELAKRYRPSGLIIHDFEIISIGLASGISKVATFNTKDFKTVEEISLIDL